MVIHFESYHVFPVLPLMVIQARRLEHLISHIKVSPLLFAIRTYRKAIQNRNSKSYRNVVDEVSMAEMERLNLWEKTLRVIQTTGCSSYPHM